MSTSPDIYACLEPVVSALGLDLDDAQLLRHGKQRVLEIILDADGGVDLDHVALASRAISEFLDQSNVMGESAYTLEVSSRGVGTPLTKPAHWRRNVGRLVKMTGDAIDVTGRILGFDDPQVTIAVGSTERTIDISTVSRATIEVEFSRKDDQ
jgi:ribosome maturation factor RimP